MNRLARSPACTGEVSAEGSRCRRPHAHSGRIVGAAAELGPLGGGAGADARVGGRTCCAKYRAPDVTLRERVRQAQPDSLAGASRAPLYDNCNMGSTLRLAFMRN